MTTPATALEPESTPSLPRIGFAEPFESIDPWLEANAAAEGTPLALHHENSTLKLTTPCGALDPGMRRDDWPEWPKDPATSFTNLTVSYDVLIDFDTYRYLVVHIVEKGTYALLSVNGAATKVCYATGVHSQDLSTLGLKGKKTLTFTLRTLNCSNCVAISSIRLVSELTDDERAGFIDEGLTVYDEGLTGLPYHGLEAVNARAGRPPKRDPLGGEWLVYRDTGTGAQVWRMTAGPENEQMVGFNADGSAFSLRGRGGRSLNIFDWPTRVFIELEGEQNGPAPRFAGTDPATMVVAKIEPLGSPMSRYSLHQLNFRDGTETEIAAFESDAPHIVHELVSSPNSNKLMWGFRETPHVYLVDPDQPDPSQRVRHIELTTRLKGLRFNESDDDIGWYNCYTYEGWRMDLATGRVRQDCTVVAGGHSIGGTRHIIGPYANLAKILVRNAMETQTEATADDVRIFGNYRHAVETDYGEISPDGRYAVTDGSGGDLAGQHLLIPLNDAATFLRASFHNTSRNDWGTNTYSWTSPDSTKVAWVCDQFDVGDIHLAVTASPAAPTGLRAETGDGGSTVLTWGAPAASKEISGYRLYRSRTSGYGFAPLDGTPVAQTRFVDTEGSGDRFYMVAAVEPSGLEGLFSNEAAISGEDVPRTLHLQAEQGQWAAPMREVLHGDAAGSRYLRIHHASPDEPKHGILTSSIDLPSGKFSLWLRGRAQIEAGSVEWRVGDQSAQSAVVRTTDNGKDVFRWFKASSPVQNDQPDTVAIALSASTDGIAIDAIALSSDPSFDPATAPITLSPEPVTGLEAYDVAVSSLKLRWKPSPTDNLARYDIHAGDGAHGNVTIIGSTVECAFEDWGLSPDTEVDYSVIAVDSRGNAAPPVTVSARTAPCLAQTLDLPANVPELKAGEAVSFPFDIAEDGTFLLWATYSPAYVSRDNLVLGVEIDGDRVGDWKLRAPYRPMAWTLKPVEDRTPRTWTDKIVVDGQDLFELSEGSHTITLTCDADPGDQTHGISTLYVSNDQGWRPRGYDPRANHSKRR